MERLQLEDNLHYPIRLDAREPEFGSLLKKGRLFVQRKAWPQALDQRLVSSPFQDVLPGMQLT